MIDDSYDPPFPKMGVPNASLVMSNSEWLYLRNGYPIQFMFRYRVGFSLRVGGSTDASSIKPKMAVMIRHDMP